MDRIFDLAWQRRQHESKRGIADAVIVNPKHRREAEKHLSGLLVPKEDFHFEMLAAHGYSIDQETGPIPDYIWMKNEIEWVPVWIHQQELLTLNLSTEKSYRVVKAKLDEIDFQVVKKLEKLILKYKKEENDYSHLLKELKKAKKTTFRSNIRDMIIDKLGDHPENELILALKKASWFMYTNVLHSPESLKASYSYLENHEISYGKKKVRHGINLFFCYERNLRSDAYVERFALHAKDRKWKYKDWFFFDQEPKKSAIHELRIGSGEDEPFTYNAEKKSEEKFSAETIKKQTDLVKKLIRLSSPESNNSAAERDSALVMAKKICEKYELDFEAIQRSVS